MREIKFRGQRIGNNEWVNGDLIHGVNSKHGKVFILPVEGGVQSLSDGIDPIDGYEVTPETIGQLYEHKDKSGNDIYEGDIIETVFKDSVGGAFAREHEYSVEESDFGFERNEIRFVDGAFCWIGENTGEAFRLEESDCKISTVVGNIHENKELL